MKVQPDQIEARGGDCISECLFSLPGSDGETKLAIENTRANVFMSVGIDPRGEAKQDILNLASFFSQATQ